MAGFRKKQRIQLIMVGVVFLVAAVSMVIWAGGESLEYALTPTQIEERDTPEGTRIRLIGLVADDSVVRGAGSEVRFAVTDTDKSIEVFYDGILPDLFREGQGTIATGRFEEGRFVAREVLAKHDENYMPKEVADALKEQGVFRAE